MSKQKISLIDKHEKDRLNKLSRDLVITLDPAPILDALLIEYTVHKNGTEYLFKSHAEKTPSTRFKLFPSGVWAFCNFADRSQKGTVLKFLETYSNMDFSSAINFCYDYLPGAINYYKEAYGLAELTSKYSFDMEEKLEELRKKREENTLLSEKNASASKVTNAYEIYNKNEKANEFYQKRGLDKHPPFIMIIKGEYEKFHEDTNEIETKYQTGIGVLTGDVKKQLQLIKDKKQLPEETSADIHYFKAFVKKDGSVSKTQSFGQKTFSYWLSDNNENKDEVLIFESKFDAAASFCFEPDIWAKHNVVIANGVNTAKEIGEFILANNFKKIKNYNQNDFPAVNFIYEIYQVLLENNKIEDFEYEFVKYHSSEHKLDINDLYKEGKFTSNRFSKTLKAHYFDYLNIALNMSVEKEKSVKSIISKRSDIELIDKKILDLLKTSKNKIKDLLYEEELRRYEILLNEGFIKDENKRQLLEKNPGVNIEALNQLNDLETRKKEIRETKKKLREIGETMSIKTNNELKKSLYEIDFFNDEEYENTESIIDYIKANKDNKELNEIIDEWVKNSCENNTKEAIERATFLCFMEFEEILNKKFKLINIGKNISTPKKEEKNATIEEEKKINVDFVIDSNNFIEEDDEEEIIEEIQEVEKKEVALPEIKNQQEIKIEQNDTLIQDDTKDSKKIETNNSPSSKLDLTYEFDNFEKILNKVNEDLQEAKKTETNEISKPFKKDIVANSKVAYNSIWNRLSEDSVVSAIKNEENKELRDKLITQRNEISNKCKETSKTIKIIEEDMSQNIEGKKINTNNIDSKKIVEDLYVICSKISSTVENMKKTLQEVKKNNEMIEEKNISPSR